MGQHEVREYLQYWAIHKEESSESIRKALEEKMFKLYYYHLTPADKKIIEQQIGKPVSV